MIDESINQNQPSKQETAGSTLVLNALLDLVIDEEDHINDDDSRILLRDVYEKVTTAAERSAFADALRKTQTELVDSTVSNAEIVEKDITPVLNSVEQELRNTEVRTVLSHETVLSVPPHEAVLYSFYVQRSPEVLATLHLSDAVKHSIERGATAVAGGEYKRAVEAFEKAVSSLSNPTFEERIVAHILAALAHYLNGDIEQSRERLAGVRERDSSLTAKLLGLVVNHNSPEKFRNGEMASRIFLPGNIDIPDDCSVLAYWGTGRDDDEWVEIGDNQDCIPLSALEAETRIRLRFSGVLPSFPTVYGYYLTYGIVDSDDAHAVSSEEILLSGPIHDTSTETIQFVRTTN